MTQPLLQAADLRGAARLTPDAVAEALSGWLAPASTTEDPEQASRPERAAGLAVLNGLLGDHLAATGNPLAITMALRQAGVTLPLERLALRARLSRPTPRLLVLLHGLCMNDQQWRRAGHDDADGLAHELGYTPIHLHYNTGLSISTNGRILALLMENLYDAWPMPIERLAMVGHSMGGLVARSAIHHGLLIQRGRLRWPARVADLVCLGTPHQGAPLERAGHGIDLLLGTAPHAAPLARLAGLCSAGINDLRLGNVVPGPASDDGTFRCEQVRLPVGTRCFAIAGCLGSAGEGLKSGLPGDGLVPVDSALGHHDQPERRLDFAPERQAVVDRTNHLDLLSSAKVHGLLRQWLR